MLGVSEEEAVDILYRPEIDKVSDTMRYSPPATITENTVIVQKLSNFAGIGTVLCTDIGANIDLPTPARLAQLAERRQGRSRP